MKKKGTEYDYHPYTGVRTKREPKVVPTYEGLEDKRMILLRLANLEAQQRKLMGYLQRYFIRRKRK